jgi:hypothetical protein
VDASDADFVTQVETSGTDVSYFNVAVFGGGSTTPEVGAGGADFIYQTGQMYSGSEASPVFGVGSFGGFDVSDQNNATVTFTAVNGDVRPVEFPPYRDPLRADHTQHNLEAKTQGDSTISAAQPVFRRIGVGEKGAAFGAPFTIYLVGSRLSFTVDQFLSARLIFSASFLRHSVVQYFV